MYFSTINTLLVAVLVFSMQNVQSAAPSAQTIRAMAAAGTVLQSGPEVPAPLPGSGDGWSLFITRSGGFAPGPNETIALNSLGNLSCATSENSCGNGVSVISAGALSALTSLIMELKPGTLNAGLPQDMPPSVCTDCVTSVFFLWRRVSGVSLSYRARLDPTTRGTIPPDILKIYDAVMKLRINPANVATPRP